VRKVKPPLLWSAQYRLSVLRLWRTEDRAQLDCEYASPNWWRIGFISGRLIAGREAISNQLMFCKMIRATFRGKVQ
jgi:hypothetical protein